MKRILSIIMLLALVLTLVACGEKKPAGDLDAALAYINNLYKDLAVETPSDYDVAGKLSISGVEYTVTWSVDVSAGVSIKESTTSGFYTVDVDEKTATEIVYVLKATIKDPAGNSIEKTFNHKVPAFKLSSFAEYAAAEVDAPVVVAGVISGIVAKSAGSNANSLYIQDANNEGGYYVYNLEKDPLTEMGLKLGMTVEVTGKKALYSGTYEVVDATVVVTDETVKTVTPVDYTEIFKNAEKLTDAALVEKQGMLVTIKGVELTGQNKESGYYNFKLGNLETYVRISSSNNCITKDEQAAFIADHTAKFGYVADVTGIISVYSGAFYLIPATPAVFANATLPTRTDAEKVDMELGTVKVDGIISESKEITLPLKGTTYTDVVLSWASDNAAIVIDSATGKATVTVADTPVTVKLTLTVKCGNETKTKEFTVNLAKFTTPEAIVDAAYALKENETLPGTYTLSGVIVEVNTAYSADYKNVTVTIMVNGMKDKLIECYRLQGEGADKIAVGDNITVTGVLKNYKGKVEFDAKCTLDSYKTAKDVMDALYALKDGESLEGTWTLTGEITKVDTPYSADYKNITVTIKVGDKEVQCYRLKGEGADKLAVGQTITVCGKLKNYKGTFEFDSGCQLVPAAGTEGGEATGTQGGTETVAPPVAEGSVKYTFADHAEGTQYGKNEVHKLDEVLTVTTDDAHFTKQLRLYHNEKNDNSEAHHATAVFASTKVINSLIIRAGHKEDTLKVSGSVDGTTWTLIQDVAVKSDYADYTVEIANSTYKYIKLESTAKQIRVETLTVAYAG